MIFANYPGHLAAIAVLLITAALLFLAFRSSEIKKTKFKFLRPILLGIKFLTIVILILILWNPSKSKRVATFSRNNVLVLFDTSRSMSVADEGNKTRLDKALRIFDEKFRYAGVNAPEFKILGFDSDVYHSGSTQLLRRWGAHSNMLNISAMLSKYDSAQDIQNATPENNSQTKGAVIFTDGQADSRQVTMYRPLTRTDFPILIVGVGSKKTETDAEIKTIRAPVRALINSSYIVSVTAAADNLTDDSVTIELLKDNIVIDSAKFQANEFSKKGEVKNNEVTVEFNVGADTLGSYNLTARIKAVKNEVNLLNNVQSTIVEVVNNDMLKVLFYAQAAQFDVGKLREVLSMDPRIHLDFCLDAIKQATRSLQVGNDLGYAQLPQTSDEFNKYDIIILGNLASEALTKQQIDGMYNFIVQRGGGLIVLPGREDYGPSTWKNPMLNFLLPVIFDPETPKKSPPEPQEVQLTNEVNNIIVLASSEIPYDNFTVSAFYNIAKTKPASSTLAMSGDTPLIIVQRVGRGRICLLNISKLFSWYCEDKNGGWLYSLMSGLTSYIGKAPSRSAGIELFTERKNDNNNKLKFTAYVRDNTFSPVEQANVLLNFNNNVYAMEPSGSGYYVTEIDNVQTDRITASAQAEIGGVFLGEKPIAINLPSRKTEMSDTKFNEAFLQALAKQLKGNYVYADNIDNNVTKLFDAQTRAGYTNQMTSIWPGWLLWGLLCLLLCVEWFIRRAKGLV